MLLPPSYLPGFYLRSGLLLGTLTVARLPMNFPNVNQQFGTVSTIARDTFMS
jgi:hypothetical protein